MKEQRRLQMFNTPKHNNLVESIKKSTEYGHIQLKEENQEEATNKTVRPGQSLESYLRERKSNPIEVDEVHDCEVIHPGMSHKEWVKTNKVDEPLKGKGYPYNEDDDYEKDMERVDALKRKAEDERDRRRERNNRKKDDDKRIKDRRAEVRKSAKTTERR